MREFAIPQVGDVDENDDFSKNAEKRVKERQALEVVVEERSSRHNPTDN